MDVSSQVYITSEVLIGVASIVGNTLVLVAIYKYHKLQTVTNCFIASLAIADLLVGIIVAPLAALSYLGLPRHFLGCVFANSVVVMFTQISIFNLVAIAVERFVAIKEPFFYERNLTIKASIIIISITWVLAIIIGLVPVFGWNLGSEGFNNCNFVAVIDMNYMVYFNFFGFVLTPLIIMFLIYSYIFYIIKQQMAKIAALEMVQESEQQRARRKFKKEVKAAKSLAIVIGIFAVCWLPIHILNSISLFCRSGCSLNWDVYGKFLLTAILLSHVNSAVNPFLYAIGNSQFQIAFKKMFCGKYAAGMISDEMTSLGTRNKKPVSTNSENKNNVHIENNKNTNVDKRNSESSTSNGHVNGSVNNDTNPGVFVIT